MFWLSVFPTQSRSGPCPRCRIVPNQWFVQPSPADRHGQVLDGIARAKTAHGLEKMSMINPHFDENLVIWSDEYSGRYHPVRYEDQFDHQWKLFLEKQTGFHKHTGVETSDPWINDRIFELTGVRNYIEARKFGSLLASIVSFSRSLFGDNRDRRNVGGRLVLDPKFPVDHFRGKRCLDVGCGAGRWTRTLLELGAQVKSVDVSEHGLQSTRRFNQDVEFLNLFDILDSRLDLHEAFDFAVCWGVIMCTHDPTLAFENVARTVKPGGQLYTMTYAPGYHDSEEIMKHRKYFHRDLLTIQERVDYAYSISDTPENCINQLDMLNTFYNWVVPESLVHDWFQRHGFHEVVTLNAKEVGKCAYHVRGAKKVCCKR